MPAPEQKTTAGSEPRLTLTLAIGVGAGFLSGMFGVGGGILVVPALVMLMRMDQRLANGTSLGAVLPISVASLVTYWSHDNVDWALVLWLAIGALAGAVIGTRLLAIVPHKVLGYMFVAILAVTAVRLFFPVTADGRDSVTWITAVLLVLIGMLTGTLAGLLGIGGGVVLVPILVVVFSEPSVIAKGTSVAVIIPTSIMGTWRNWKARNVDLKVSAVVGVAGIVSAVGGATLADRLDQDLSNILFASLVVVVAARMLRDLRRD